MKSIVLVGLILIPFLSFGAKLVVTPTFEFDCRSEENDTKGIKNMRIKVNSQKITGFSQNYSMYGTNPVDANYRTYNSETRVFLSSDADPARGGTLYFVEHSIIEGKSGQIGIVAEAAAYKNKFEKILNCK